MTTPIIPQTTYPQYERQYVDPSAASLEELMRRFAVTPGGSSSIKLTSKETASALQPPTQSEPPRWISAYAHAEPKPQPKPTLGQGDYSTRGWAGRLTLGSGQVRPAEMSSYDLLAEADELGIAGTMVMPRPVLEKAVETMRKQRQAQQTPGVSKELRRVGAFAVGAIESIENIVSNYLGEDNVPAKARQTLGTLKAKLRLSTTEQQAADQDRAMAMGTFVGPFIPQWAMFEGINATMQAASKAPMVAAGASKFLTGWRGGAISAGAMNVLWNAQYKDMPTLPDADLWQASMKNMDSENLLDKLVGGAQATGAVMNSRVGSLLLDMGLGAVVGRWQQHGATAQPQAAQPTVPPPTNGPTGFGVQPAPGPALPPNIGPAGLLGASPLQLVNTADGVVGPMWRPPTAAEDPLSWRPLAPDVAPSNMGVQPEVPAVSVRSPEVSTPEVAQPSQSKQFTARELMEQYDRGDARWTEAVPVPAAGENEFPNWQNLPAARLARASGSVLTKPDGSLIALFHESGGPFDGPFNPSNHKQLTGAGAYFRDRADVAYAEFSEKVGYGVQRSAQSQAEYARISKLAEGLQTQVDNMESALRLSGKKPPEVISRITELKAQLGEYEARMNELSPTMAPTTHPVFAVVTKPYYFDAAMPRERVEEILDVIRKNDTFENLREALRQTEGEFEQLFHQGPGGSTKEPMGQQVHQMLGQLWKETPDGVKTLFESGQVNDLLKAAGYDAIHNIGGVRAQVAREAGMQYNAWNILDPERQIIRVFAPPPMSAEVAHQSAVQLTKQAAVVESPLLVSAAEKVALTDADVVAGNIATRPYGVQIVRGVKEPGTLMQQISAKAVGVGGIEPTSVRLVPRELTSGGVKTFDVMVSTGQPITDKMVEDYAKHGVFEGMHGVDKSGNAVEVLNVFVAKAGQKNGGTTLTEGKTYLTTRKIDQQTIAKPSGVKARTYISTIDTFLERRVAQAPLHPQDPALSTLVSDYMSFAVKKLGIEPEDLLSADAMRQMPKLFDEFADSQKLAPGARHLVSQLVERDMNMMARDMMGDEFKAVDDALVEAIADVSTDRIEDVPQAALVRGLSATHEPGTPRWVVRGPGANQWIFDNDNAAMAFLSKYDVDVPDLSPGAPIIPDVARSGMPDTHFTVPPTLAEQVAHAEGSDVLARAGIDAAKLEQNLERDLLGGAYGATPGPAQPASAPAPLVAGAAPRPSAALRGQPPLPPPPPPTVPPTGGAGGLPPQGPLAALQPQFQNVARNVMSIERELTSFSMQHVLPSSYFFDRMEKLLFDAGAPSIRPGQQMEQMRTLISKFYNESEPHIAKLTRYMDDVSSGTRRGGKIWRALDLPMQPTATQPVSRAMYMAQENFTPKEVHATNSIEQMLVDVFGGNQQQANRVWTELKLYTSMVERNIVNGALNPYRVPQQLVPNIQHFVEHAERRQLRLEVPEVGNIMYEFLRSHYWSQNVKPEWDQMQAGWRALSRWQDQRGERVLRPVADHVLSWMSGVENGFMPKTDPVINAVQSGLQLLGVPLTKNETMQLISGGMSSAYRALLGWNPASTIRDSFQFLGAAPWTGIGNLKESIREVVGSKGAAVKQAVWQRALQEGWTELGIPPHPGSNVHQSAMLPGAPPLQTGFNASEEARRELAQNIGDFFRDMTPSALRSIEGTKLDPLWAYTNQGVVFRIVVANAATKRFDQVMAQPQSISSALRAMGADVMSFAQRRNIEEALIAGQTSEARKIYTNTVANTVMNRYGLKEGAVGNHTVMGRLWTQLGGHSSHQLAGMINLVNGGFTGATKAEKALNFATGKASPTLYKMTGMMGMMAGALYVLQQKTGWNLMKMHPLNWAANPQMLGGPLKEPLTTVANAVTQLPQAVLSDNPSYEQRQTFQQLLGLPGQMLEMAGAPAAAFRVTTGVARAAQDNTPESLARYLLTGDKRPQNAITYKQGAQSLYEYLEGKRGTGAQ